MRRFVLSGVLCAGVLGITIEASAQRWGQRPIGEMAQITSCRLARTGFLGMGRDRVADVMVWNMTQRARAFTIRIFALYPGGGREEAGVQGVTAAPGTNTPARIRFRPRPGMTSIECDVDR